MSNDENKFQPIFLVTTIGMRFLQVCLISVVAMSSKGWRHLCSVSLGLIKKIYIPSSLTLEWRKNRGRHPARVVF